jgi:glycosyltransferase involved in cell wall biosynthesis
MTPPFRVLMTADAVGGVWTYALELARALAPFDVRTTLVTMGPLPDGDQLAAAATVPGLDLLTTTYKLEWMPHATRDIAEAGAWLLALEARLLPSIVHLNGFAHGALAWRAPVVVVGHSCVLSWNEALGGGIDPQWLHAYREMMGAGLRAASWVVAPSAAMLRALQRHYGPLDGATVVPNGRSPERCVPLGKEPFVLTAGRLWDRAKNVSALKTIETRLSWPLVVAGDVAIGLGRWSDREIADALGRASIFALPARYEPFGLLPLEAALCGCALVLGDIPSLREIWGEAALYVNPCDGDALHTAIESLIADPDRLVRYAWRARRRATVFNPDDMARRYLAIYRRVLGGRGVDPWSLPCAS